MLLLCNHPKSVEQNDLQITCDILVTCSFGSAKKKNWFKHSYTNWLTVFHYSLDSLGIKNKKIRVCQILRIPYMWNQCREQEP